MFQTENTPLLRICNIENLDIVAVIEIWLKHDETQSMIAYISSPGYSFFHKPRADQRAGEGALPMSLPSMRFRIPLSAGFSEKYHVFPLSILGHCFDVVFLGKALHPHMLHLTQYCN